MNSFIRQTFKMVLLNIISSYAASLSVRWRSGGWTLALQDKHEGCARPYMYQLDAYICLKIEQDSHLGCCRYGIMDQKEKNIVELIAKVIEEGKRFQTMI